MTDRHVLVYVDLDGAPQRVGRLWGRMRKARESATFEYDDQWLKHPARFPLEPALALGKGPLHTPAGRQIFGALGDSAPDRWGRVLIQRNERRKAREENRPPHTLREIDHLAETSDEMQNSQKQHKMSPTRYLESLNFWGPRTLAAHAVWLDDADIEILAKRKVGVAHNPESNMKLASGTAKVPAMRKASVNVGLGTDGAASNNDLDMFEAMRQAALLQKHATRDPRALPAKDALAMATIEGARALGMADRVGSLEAGKRADLIVVAMDGARQTPMYDPISHLVYVARGEDVRTSIVNGKVLMRDRKMLTLNEADVIREANEIAKQVRAAVKK